MCSHLNRRHVSDVLIALCSYPRTETPCIFVVLSVCLSACQSLGVLLSLLIGRRCAVCKSGTSLPRTWNVNFFLPYFHNFYFFNVLFLFCLSFFVSFLFMSFLFLVLYRWLPVRKFYPSFLHLQFICFVFISDRSSFNSLFLLSDIILPLSHY